MPLTCRWPARRLMRVHLAIARLAVAVPRLGRCGDALARRPDARKPIQHAARLRRAEAGEGIPAGPRAEPGDHDLVAVVVEFDGRIDSARHVIEGGRGVAL